MWPVIYGRAQMSTSRVLVYLAILVIVLGPLRFGNGPGPLGNLLGKVTEFALPVNTFLADCILIWRCWAVWNRKTKIVFLPANQSVLSWDQACVFANIRDIQAASQ
ncbi:hypothetical protein B0H14DRAFT_3727082 [Mycena olivaceomarginata]|nr:hypothetical protein B0H14DRAFT_3727082 [Mycena olivaceomarginata]